MKFDTLIEQLSCNICGKICGLIHSDNARIRTNMSLGWISKVNTIQYLVIESHDNVVSLSVNTTESHSLECCSFLH